MNFLTKALLKSQLKGVPEEQVNLVISLVEKNPDLFKKIAEEVKSKTAQGMTQQDAMTKVMLEHESELKDLLSK